MIWWTPFSAKVIANLPLVVRAVAVERGHLRLDLVQQGQGRVAVVRVRIGQQPRDDRVAVGVDRQVDLPPVATLALAALTDLPLPLAAISLGTRLEARAVDHDVDRPAGGTHVDRDVQLAGAFHQARVAPDRHARVQELRQRAAEALGLAVGQPEQLADRQPRLDRPVSLGDGL